MNPSQKSHMKEYQTSDYRHVELIHTFGHVMKTGVAKEIRGAIIHFIASGKD